MLLAALAAGCVSGREPERRPAVYVGAGMAGANNPDMPKGDDDNLTVAAGGWLPLWDRPWSIRTELHAGDKTVMATPSLTYVVALAGRGPGAIDGHVGLGYTWHEHRRNSVLGNTDSPFFRLGADGYLVNDILAGAALLIAPWGYNHDDTALAGIVYFGIRF